MAKHAIGPMILAASLLSVPVLAAQTPDTAATTSPAGTSQSTVAPNSGMTANTMSTRTTAQSANNMANPSAPSRYTTTDGQMRVGKIVGASVYNDQKQSIGSVEDVLMSADNKAATAVLSVGGFLGMGSKYVSVPFDQLKITNNEIVMPGATKSSLQSMPAYQFNNNA
jgi:sporulation protein YlmC with PRC-barrel domain